MKTPAACWLAGLLGTAIALLLPLLLLLGGFAIDVINRDHERIEGIGLDTLSTPGSAESFGSMTSVSKLGPFEWNHRSLPWVGSMEGSKSSLGLLGLFGVGLLLCTWMQWMNRRASVHTALDTEQQLHESLYRHSGALAIERGLSAQADLLRSFHNQAIPAIRSAVVDWYQVFPMVLMLGILLLLLAAAIHPWLTVAAVLAGLIVRNLYQMHLYRQINEHAIDQQRWGNAQEQLSKIAQDAPLMATIHSSQETFESFRSSFQNYRTAGSNVLSWEKIKSPVIASTTVLLGIGILFLLALGMLDPRKHLSLGAACVWIASVSMALVAWVRFSTAWRVLKKSQPKLKAVYDYLAIESKPTLDSKAHSPIAGNSDSTSSSGRSTPNRLSQGVQIEHLTLLGGTSQKLLNDVSVEFKPGQLTAVVSSDPFLAKALVELALGFGQPYSGRLLFDGIDSKDITSQSIRDLSLWIAANGPLVTGSIEDNLWLGYPRDATIDLRDVLRKARVDQAVFGLPDGLQTLVSSQESRLSVDLMFRLGIARGFLKNPSLVVAEEPTPNNAGIEIETTRALLELKNLPSIVLVLPSRVSTLRAADQVVMLHKDRIVEIGTHVELLERSELYRHWNYVHFAPVPS